MLRNPLLFLCLFVISLNICVFGTQDLEANDLFGIYTARELLKEEPESVASLGDREFQEEPKCSSDSDCFHEGKCTNKGTCSCRIGTNGTLCENVVECLKHPDMCGKGTDVKCVFDAEYNTTECQCLEKKKHFNDRTKRCSAFCKEYEKNGTKSADCGIYGRCVNAHCVCVKGISGDFCENIDQCKEVDCGNDPSATCILGIDGAYCRCKEPYQVFDKNDKVCRGDPCKKDDDCSYGGECTTDGTCSCPAGTTGIRCQDVRGCIENPKKCGNGTDVRCIFSVFDKEATCSCDAPKKAFDYFAERCAEPCEKYVNHKLVKDDCGMYGRCTNSFCVCVEGVSGDRCETIDQCASGEVDCTNDPAATCSLGMHGAYCKCNKAYQMFDKKDKLCKGEPCKEDSDCMFGGNCTKEDGICSCVAGVGGPRCQLALECEEKPDMCGSGTDVKCVYDADEEKAVCRCDDDKKAFDAVEKKCKNICLKDDKCGMYGSCDKNGFCRCLAGVTGDYCETIEKCKSMDCGVRTNCTLGSDGEAHCKCLDPHLGFNYERKTCEACECGDNSKGCEFRGGEKICECAVDYYRKGDKCEACNCGEISRGCELRDGKKECFCPLNYTTIGDSCQKCNCGIGSFHCRMEGEKTKCVCYETYKQRKDKCEFCDCGVHGGNCSFTDSGEKQCICKEGFTMLKETGFCTEMCNDTNPCKNEGKCQEGVCKCPEDYGGAWCETAKWCMHSRCGNGRDKVRCIWDSRKKEGRCECEEPNHFYDEERRSCDKCDCGRFGRCIMTKKGEKVCICDVGYADYLLTCKRCDCGAFSTNCTFQSLGKKLCQCMGKHKQQDYTDFYGDDISNCVYCDCGEHGSCHFEGKKQVCDCEENYKEHNGICRECNCGPYGFCSFAREGYPFCTCDFGYSVRNGSCESCDCEPPNVRGIGTVCQFDGSKKECHCPRGYQSPINDFCKDIDECLNPTACPENTVCVNLPGSYKCECKKGFKVHNVGVDPKKFGCEDINECMESPCTGTNTMCVNFPGSYDCKCKDGFYPTSGTSGLYYNPKFATCNKEETQWRGASIALGVILSIGIIGVGGYIYYQRKGFRR